MSGHSKWSTIKHKKGAADARRGQLFTKLTREIIVAAKQGGANLDSNFRLRLAVQKARNNSMPSDNIDRAIKRATGQLEGETLIEMLIEGYGPSGTAIMTEVVTDNKNRAVAELRHAFSKNGGNMGESGCVAWLFERHGVIGVNAGGKDPDEITLMAIDAGAEDVNTDGDYLEIYTTPENIENVSQELEKANLEVTSAEVSMVPSTTVSLEGKAAEQVLRLISRLEDLDDVQSVYSNADIPDEIMENFQS